MLKKKKKKKKIGLGFFPVSIFYVYKSIAKLL